MSATISGMPAMPTAGFFAFTVQAADAGTPPLSAIRALTITIGLPAMPTASVTNVQDTIAPSSQPAFGVTIAQSYPVDLAGSATIVFQPDSGPQST